MQARAAEAEDRLRQATAQSTSDAEAAQAKISDLVAAAGRHTLQIADLEQRLATAESGEATVTAQLSDAQARVAVLERDLETARDEATAAAAAADAARAEATTQAEQLAEAAAKLEQARQKHRHDKMHLKVIVHCLCCRAFAIATNV